MRLFCLLLPVLLLSGCKLFTPAPDRGPDAETASLEPIVADCIVVEYDNLARESTDPRVRDSHGVTFDYTRSHEVSAKLAELKVKQLFVLSHGWQNDIQGAREFYASLIKGIVARAQRDSMKADDLAFLVVSWNSERGIFHESAKNAEVIGSDRLSPLLIQLSAAHGDLPITLVGHSLGARLVLGSLRGAVKVRSVVLLEGAAARDALLPDQAQAFGTFPGAAKRTGCIINVHSQQDEVLNIAYRLAMQGAALGREGADLDKAGRQFPSCTLVGDSAPKDLFQTLERPGSRAAGNPVINVDASAVISGHSEVFVPGVFDLIWLVATKG